MFKYFIFILTLFFVNILNAEDSLLTLKQKLDRLQREVSDLSQTVYKGSRDSEVQPSQPDEELKSLTSNLTILDLRIHNLEKEIKKFNDELIIQIFDEVDDLKNLYEGLTLNIDNLKNSYEKLEPNTNTQLQNSQNNLINKNEIKITNDNNTEEDIINNENILGSIVISSEDLSNKKKEVLIQNKSPEESVAIISPEDEFQRAFDMLRSQKFSDAKDALKKFIDNHKEDDLSGSAHYWLGEVYLLKKEYREAALVLAEGYQKFPKSIKAPDMLYKLSESLINISKKNDGCNTLIKLTKEFPQHKFSIKAENKIISLDCNVLTE